LAAAYASMNDGKYLLTNADKVGNTPAWQNRYKVNESTGEMLYEMADHLKEAYEEELIARIDATLEELRRLDEGKIPAGLQAYLDKKKGKKGNGDKKEEENGNGKDHGNGNGSKGSKPDFLDLDKDGDKKEPMKKAAKEKKEETEYNYVNAYVEKVMGADPTMRMMAAKDRMKGKDKLLSKKKGEENAANMARKIKMSPSYAGAMGEEVIKSGIFTEEEIAKFLWVEFDEGYQRNPEKDPQNKPYREKTKAERMADPERGINSPAFKKFMADRGMSV
jgi:Mn-dependent DtxR family transcriptional regulator